MKPKYVIFRAKLGLFLIAGQLHVFYVFVCVRACVRAWEF